MILASEAGLRSGFSRLLFAEWADSDLNTIILTSRDGNFQQLDTLSDLHEMLNQNNNEAPSLVSQLIGLANKEPWAQLPTNTHGDPILSLTLSQRVAAEDSYDNENGVTEKTNEIPSTPSNVQSGSSAASKNLGRQSSQRKIDLFILKRIYLTPL